MPTFLCLDYIPRSGRGYYAPEAMVNGLPTLTRLRSLRLALEWQTPRSPSHQASGPPPPLSRVVLPALTDIFFLGDKEYLLEDIVSRIDTPLLANIFVTFIDRLVSTTPLLQDFISRTETFVARYKVDISSSGNCAEIEFFRRDGEGV